MGSIEQTTEILLCLSPAEVANLKEGINFVRNKSTGKDYILYKSKSHLRACKNMCKHQGGLFIKDIEDLDGRSVRCTKHNWKLDVSTMKYINPPGSFCQDELVVEKNEENGLLFLELNPPNPWDSEPRSPEDLAFGEVQITYLTHACMDLKLGDKRMVFDPWLIGPAFARGWWLLHEPPSDWLERLYQADLIYISHMHSDHLSYPTLKKVAGRRPDIPIYVGNTERPVFWNLKRSGVQLTNINVVPFGIWQQVDRNLRFMILMDGVHPEMDTCIIVEYKGHKILNTVDCTRPNGGRLPMKVDLMMSDFAGGASGFPMTFSGGKFTEEWKAQFIKTERKKLLNYKARLVKDLQPRIYCPFAGYFVESHPSDKYIKETNIKNDPNELNNLIKKNSDVLTWTPRPGATLDLGRMLKDPTDRKGIIEPPEGTKIYKDSWDFGPYLRILNAAVGDEIFRHSCWIKEYFTWAGFKDYNLVVRMIETDEDFSPFPGGYDYLVDFLDLSFPKERPSREHPYEEGSVLNPPNTSASTASPTPKIHRSCPDLAQLPPTLSSFRFTRVNHLLDIITWISKSLIRSRVDVIRHVVKNGLLWDDLYIGFQTRLQRDPDVYHHLFWNHFQIKLPLTPPNWKSFLMYCG
ncbi:cytidine monophosphate-N-acetylneuraminic acid hydroxylase isoform X1 [Delphinus delphis]|uniref:cytidine monophosphate-N-acetylneuraminic acid hydroxylase isoform X1 n=1 Tax=Delphinus delphis TaxID=9728 RepID=UPI00122ECD48|nr:cytidine monophosphate-N-acetylneuraminic acid hydroxylase-like isoform X1 [Globicephala melas]XP_059879511.1 cytidine monophosphate-N-acetylneuraminic acid hydroxylase isoform X1 [Delphinus delphis]XP_059879512.1 cytidine monophosphate-N-acetylneuraminic acid hydroxylase isoform X1 [Delphinus delphis]XP_059879513.1 cytidine monophosphate-N-acetylneuraminic acid hydroxylase isoform X1 [Delphinus delphis]XP_059879514.1 cytidine monophosphate-N-acetylneuraminic acid hydroxylase isoform X1 [Del